MVVFAVTACLMVLPQECKTEKFRFDVDFNAQVCVQITPQLIHDVIKGNPGWLIHGWGCFPRDPDLEA